MPSFSFVWTSRPFNRRFPGSTESMVSIVMVTLSQACHRHPTPGIWQVAMEGVSKWMYSVRDEAKRGRSSPSASRGH